ncbi:MAG: apolipoprotein N-acyltransferase [Robiginitomaculum sp.]|nr:apolipoprotein N-acyltransferase [Robiginitomaculum sp.]
MGNTSLNRVLNATGFAGFVVNILLGALPVLGHAPFFLWPITIICFALFMLRLDFASTHMRPKRSGFWYGFTFALGYFIAGLYWIGSAFIARGPEFVPFMPFAILLMAAGLALFWALAGLVYVRFSRGGSSSIWRAGIFACVFFIAEFLRGHIFSGFPWNLPGYVFPAGKPISQIASIVGIYGLTALVFFISASLALWIDRKQKWLAFAAAAAVLLTCYGYGSLRLGQADIQYVENVKLRIVHANIPQRDKFDPDKYVSTINTYLELSRSPGFEDVTHIIWPEGAVPGLMFEDPGLMAALGTMFRSGSGTPPIFITQTLRAELKPGTSKLAYYNAAAAVTFKDGQAPLISPYYDKQKLVPFGEFIPGGGVLEKLGLHSLSSALESMTAGKSGGGPSLPGLPPVSIQICYEIIFPGFTARSQPHGGQSAKWILNLSNDSWYGNSTGPRQHINQARYRAIEQSLPVVRATSGGVSGVIDPYGRQLNQLGLGQQGVIDARLPQPINSYKINDNYQPRISYIILLLIVFLLIGCKVCLHRKA